MTEVWKPVVGYNGLYEVSSLGRIKSLPKKGVPTEKILKPNIPGGKLYYAIGLTDNGVKKTFSVHRLVLSAFVGESDLHVNHKNLDSFDNHLENLEYVTRRENTNHSYGFRTTGLTGVSKKHYKNGKYISMISINGKKEYLGQFDTPEEASQVYLNKAKELGEDRYCIKHRVKK